MMGEVFHFHTGYLITENTQKLKYRYEHTEFIRKNICFYYTYS